MEAALRTQRKKPSAVVAVLSEMGGIFTSKQEQKLALKAVFAGQHVSALISTSLSKSYIKHCCT